MMASSASAQVANEPTPYRNIDEFGVDVSTGTFNFSMMDVAGGSGSTGLSYARTWTWAGWKDNYSGQLKQDGTLITVVRGGISESFNLVGGTWVPKKANGATMVQSTEGSGSLRTAVYTYTAADGTVTFYRAVGMQAVAPDDSWPRRISIVGLRGECKITSYIMRTPPGNEQCAVPVSITEPGKEKIDLSWNEGSVDCSLYDNGPSDQGWQCDVAYSLATVSDQSGYRLDVGSGVVSLVNTAVEYCFPGSCTGNWPNATYTTPVSGTQQVVDSNGGTWTFTFDASYRMTSIRKPTDSTASTTITYYTSNKVASVTKDGVTKSYTWSTSGGNDVLAVTGGPTGSGTFTTNPSQGQPGTIVNAASNTTTNTYDANGRLTRTTEPEGNYVNNIYDGRGNITETRLVAKSGSGLADIVTTANYDATCSSAVKCNQPNYVLDPLGNRTDYTYDTTHGQVTRIQLPSPDGDAAGTETGTRPEINYSYTALYAQYKNYAGTLVNYPTPTYKPTTITSCATAATCAGTANETKVTIEYNTPNLQPTKVTAASGNGAISSAVAYGYDARGNLTTMDGPLAGGDDTTTYVYDDKDRRRGVIGADPDGAGARPRAAERYSFDALSRVIKGESGTVTAATAVALDAMTVFQTLDTTYDAAGNKTKDVLSGTSGAVSVVQYSYDSKNRLECTALRMNPATWTSLPSSACTAATTSTTHGPDRISRNIYDSLGRVTKVESAVGTAVAADELRTAYTANGRVNYVIDAETNRTTYVYDGFDRLSQTQYPVTTKGANSSNTSDYEGLTYDARSSVTQRRLRDSTAIAYSYDDLGRLTGKDLPAGETDTSYGYDLMSRATGVTQGSHSLSFVQDALGRMTSQTGPQGTIGYTYDAASRRLTMSYPGGVLTINYDYDTAGNVTKIRENGATSGVGVLADYAYDNLGRRSSVTFGNGSAQSFGYDASQRLQTLTNNLGGSATTHDLTQTFAYNPAGQIASVARSNDAYAWQAHYNIDRAYIADGLNRIMNVGSTAFGYDGRGNLTSDGTNSFTYTAENLLKTGPGGATLAYDPLGRLYETVKSPTTTRFEYDGVDLIGEYNGGNAVQRRYVHGPGIDNPIAWYEGSAIDSTTRRFLMADERGSVVSITDSAGATVHINAYDEYGIPAPGNVGRFGYTGQTWLPELGMWYYKARIYSPTLGRFMQTDPIGYADGMNWHNYVGSDPVNFTDPMGLREYCWVEIQGMVSVGDDGGSGGYRLERCVNFSEASDPERPSNGSEGGGSGGSEIVVTAEKDCVGEPYNSFFRDNVGLAAKGAGKLGLNPMFPLGLAAYESGFGTSRMARSQNNPFGATPGGDRSSGVTYSSTDAAWSRWYQEWGSRVSDVGDSAGAFVLRLASDNQSGKYPFDKRGPYNTQNASTGGNPNWSIDVLNVITGTSRRFAKWNKSGC
ncbi:RHS repeat-associated core domain-containing protein [Sphingopyxis sp. BE259]|nr:RHS repeat-associated core domain-containing protein [Sphingopyxis sp. BE259]